MKDFIRIHMFIFKWRAFKVYSAAVIGGSEMRCDKKYPFFHGYNGDAYEYA